MDQQHIGNACTPPKLAGKSANNTQRAKQPTTEQAGQAKGSSGEGLTSPMSVLPGESLKLLVSVAKLQVDEACQSRHNGAEHDSHYPGSF